MKVLFKKVAEGAILPSFGNEDASNAGLDLYAYSPHRLVMIPARSSCVVRTGVAWEPVGGCKYAMIVQSRSGLAFKQNVEASNAGVIDHSYRGEIMVKLYNHGKTDFYIEHGMRIAQGIVYNLPFIEAVEEALELSETARGGHGFGSSGR